MSENGVCCLASHEEFLSCLVTRKFLLAFEVSRGTSRSDTMLVPLLPAHGSSKRFGSASSCDMTLISRPPIGSLASLVTKAWSRAMECQTAGHYHPHREHKSCRIHLSRLVITFNFESEFKDFIIWLHFWRQQGRWRAGRGPTWLDGGWSMTPVGSGYDLIFTTNKDKQPLTTLNMWLWTFAFSKCEIMLTFQHFLELNLKPVSRIVCYHRHISTP